MKEENLNCESTVELKAGDKSGDCEHCRLQSEKKNLKQMCIDCLQAADLIFFFLFTFFIIKRYFIGHLWYKLQFLFRPSENPFVCFFKRFFCCRYCCCFRKINISTSTWNKRFWSAQKFSLWSAWSCKWIPLCNRVSGWFFKRKINNSRGI